MKKLVFKQNSVLKKEKNSQSSLLPNNKKRNVLKGESFNVLGYKQISDTSIMVTLDKNILTNDNSISYNTWYVYIPHIEYKAKTSNNHLSRLLKFAYRLGDKKRSDNSLHIIGIEDCEYTFDGNNYIFNAIADNHNKDLLNDLIVLIDDNAILKGIFKASIEPGVHYTKNRLNRKGCARLVRNHFYKDQWVRGLHKGKPGLQQVGSILLHRDLDGDGVRDANEPKEFFTNTGVNIHRCRGGYIGRYSAGCAIIREETGEWAAFWRLINKYKPSNGKYSLTTIDGASLFS